MKKTHKEWSIEEESILYEQVKVYPKNLEFAFVATSKLINHTPSACRNRWYKELSKTPKAIQCTATEVETQPTKFKQFINKIKSFIYGN